jgi:glycosyltransferase 2 family protein
VTRPVALPTPDHSPPLRGRSAWLWLLAAMYAGAVVVALRNAGDNTWALLRSLPLSLVLALLALSLTNYALRAWRWLYLSNLMGLRVELRDNLLYYFAGYGLTATPGKAGEAVRLWFLRTGHDIGYSRSLPLMLADRILDVWAVLLLTIAGLYGWAQYRWHGAALALVVGVASAPLLLARRLESLLGLALRWLRPRRVVRLRQVLRSLERLRSWRGYGLTLLPSAAGWVAEGAALFLLLRHFNTDVSFTQAVFVFSFGMIVGAISMLPGGLGSTEVTMVVMLRAVGVPVDVALVATAIVRVTTFWFAVALGLVLLPWATRRAYHSRDRMR